MAEGSVFRVYCLDASDCALLSEDYAGTTRFHFQRELVACHLQANLSGGAGGKLKQQVVLITGSSGRASVALHPTNEVSELQQALLHVQPAGDGNLTAALKLALLMSRRFPAGSTHITAFVASKGAVSGLTVSGHPASAVAAELRESYQSSGLSLDVAVLCPRQELGEAAASALEALTGSSSSGSSSSSSSTLSSGDGSGGEGSTAAEPAAPTQASCCSTRLVWLQPVATAAEIWQQLEPALEQLELGGAGGRRSGMDASIGSASGSVSGLRPGLPRRISREPRQFDPLRHPRTPLLAQRSGVQQPALCRGESLSRLGHLSSDGMMRPWLPTYSSIGQQAAAAAAAKASATAAGAAGGGGKGGTEYCYIEVQPIPKWRTLIKVSAGRMLPDGSGPVGGPFASSVGGSLSGSGDYTAASAELLRSLQALTVLAGELGQDSSSGSRASSAAGSAATAATAATALPAVPVTYRADSRRGTLRLLQGTKEAHMLKLVWSPEPAEGDREQRTQQQQAHGFDMFSGADGGSGSGSGRVSAAHSELLTYMPASAVAASAARGPLLREGCELWEAAAEFECDLWLRTAEHVGEQQQSNADAAADAAAGSSSSSSGAAGEQLAAVWAWQLENGAQVLLVEPARERGSPLPRLVHPQRRPAAAFWLQQHVSPDTLQLPAYGTLGSKATSETAAAPGLAEAAIAAAEEPAAPSSSTSPVLAAGATVCAVASEPGSQWEFAAQHEEGGQAQVPAALLAAALQRSMQQPPRVDLRRLRRDVKSGAIQVTPICVGPLPATFVRDIVSARSSMLGGMGVENLDSWGGASSSNGSGDAGGSGSNSSSGAASFQAKSKSAVGAEAVSSQGAAAAHSTSELSETDLQKHKAAAWSLLRQRLKQQPGRSGRISSNSAAGCGHALAGAAQDPSAVTEQELLSAGAAPHAGAGPASAAIPCSSPQPALQASHRMSESCTSSAAGTPFGTPLHILPSRLVHERRASSMGSTTDDADGASAEAEAVTAAAEVAGTEAAGLPGSADSCGKISEGSDVLVGVSGQQDAHSDGIDPLFKLD